MGKKNTKTKLKGGKGEGEGRRDGLPWYCLAFSLLDFIEDGEEAAVSKPQWILWMVQPLTVL